MISVVPLLALAVHAAPTVAGRISPSVQTASDSVLWDHTVGPLLAQPLWSDRTAYDAAHFLMVPLHAAFQRGHEAWLRAFAAHFQRFAAQGFDNPAPRGSQLARSQYAFFASRFVALASQGGRAELVPPGLLDVLYAFTRNIWAVDTAFAWSRAFPGGVRARLEWKLAERNPTHAYFRAVIDVERFLFGIAANLCSYERVRGNSRCSSPVVTEILAAAQRTFEQRVVRQPEGGWLLQPGVWSDYPDFAYAGQPAIVPGMQPAPVPGVAEDASHSFRLPLLLTSLVGAYGDGDALRSYYEDLRRGLARQFVARVLVRPSADFPGFRTTNYMDGRNGPYRINYLNRGPDFGYGPFELSGSLMYGWWGFLGDSAVAGMYRDIARSFPLPPPVLALYTRGRRVADSGSPRNIMRDAYANGLLELIVRLASRLPVDAVPDPRSPA